MTDKFAFENVPRPYAQASYTTPPEMRRGLSAAFPNLSFYWRMFNTVRRAGSLAKAGKYGGTEWIRSSYEIVREMEMCGTVFEISGLEHVINMQGPCVFIANHMSTLETFALPCLIQTHRDVTFVVKQSLVDYPIFGPVLRAREPIVVTRKDLRADLAAMLQGGPERLAAGRSIIVFPQGSRSMALDTQHFNSIGVKMAKKAGVPVIPVALRTDAWSGGKLIKDFGPIRPQIGARFKFGAPIEITGNGKEEHTAVVSFIQKQLAEWGISGVTNEKPE